MKKTFKGFTLVECLVSMAILAIACMTLGGIEAAVARRNNVNHFNNTSLANQMAYIEKYSDSETVKIINTYSGGSAKKPPNGTNSGTTAYVKVTKIKQIPASETDPSKYDPLSKNFIVANRAANSSCSYPVDIYVMYSRDTKDVKSNDSNYGTVASSITNTSSGVEGESNLRYKYILGH